MVYFIILLFIRKLEIIEYVLYRLEEELDSESVYVGVEDDVSQALDITPPSSSAALGFFNSSDNIISDNSSELIDSSSVVSLSTFDAYNLTEKGPRILDKIFRNVKCSVLTMFFLANT